MHRPYKKITAQLLLFSFLLESCYNPNIGIGKQALPTPDPADKQRQYAGEPHDKYPPSHTLTTADKHPVRFTYHNGEWLAEVEEHAAHGSCQRRQVPVVFEPGLTLEDVVYSNPAEQKQLLHLCPSQEEPDQPGYVYVGRGPMPQPQLLSSPGARQTTPRNEVGLAQQQATAQQQPKELGSSAIQRNRQESRQAAPNIQQAQEQPGRQAVLALPSPVQEIGESPRSQEQLPTTPARVISKSLSTPGGEAPSQGVANTQPTSAQRAPSRRALSWRNQHELVHSQRAAQAKRAQSATRAKPANELAQPAQPRQAIIPGPSLAHKALQGTASQALLAQGGHPVRFMHHDGQWWASVRERIGVFSRVWVLPVACERHGDVAKALADLQDKPTQYTQRRIHVMHTKQLPYLPQFVYLGAQGLRGGGNGAAEASGSGEPQDEPAAEEPEGAAGREPSQSAPQGSGTSLVTLHERMAQEDIKSTAALVKALNDAQTPEEQQALQQWIRKYIEWFNDQDAGNLTLAPENIQEYSALAYIQADKPANRQLLASYFSSLYRKIKEDQLDEEPLIEALEHTLQNIDSEVFEGSPHQLIKLGDDLLARLEPTKTTFSRATYPTHCSTLYALQQALVLIQQIAPGQWNPNQEGGLYQRFRAQCKAIARDAQYYPICYHARLLKQSLQHLELTGYRVGIQDNLRRVGDGLKGAIYFYQVGRNLATLGFDLDHFRSGCKSWQAAFTSRRIQAKPWYEKFQNMNKDYLLTLEDAAKYGDFEEQLRALQDKGDMGKEEDRQALRFGIVQQLRMLALNGPPEVRHKSIDWLEDLAKPAAWGGDQAVMEGLLDGLAEIAVQSQGAEKEAAEAALERLKILGDSPAVGFREMYLHLHAAKRQAAVCKAAAQEAIKKWLGDCSTIEDKLSALPAPAASSAPGGLFSEINSRLRAVARVEHPAPGAVPGQAPALQPPALPAPVAELTQPAPARAAALPRADIAPLGAQAACQALRAHYQQPAFAQVRSLFEGEALKHVDALQCQLMLIEQVKKQADREGPQDDVSTHHERLEWVKNPIALEDLFKKRKTNPDGPARAIQRVLLVGEPGTGKTTLSRKVAYHWAQGKWGEEFEAVYVLPVRALQQSQYDNLSMRRDETLPTAIANNCFSPMEDEQYARLRRQISEELAQPSTLVVLDGLDERYGASEKLLGQALAGRHKLLMLSRPYGIEQERSLVDIEIAHAGLSDKQMEAYVKGDLSSKFGTELLQFIKEYPSIASIAHVPVNLQILCALWKDDRDRVREETRNGSLPGLYRRLTEYTWERYARERNVESENCEEVFETLGKIALDALEQGQVLISPELVRAHVEVSHVREQLQTMQAAGFLLLQSVGRQYQFPHLTFQEYFAGRWLARLLLASDARSQARVRKFLSKHQYGPQYGRTLSFLAGEVSKAQGVEGISKLLHMLHEGPQEVVGVQHLLLQLRLLNEWLCVAGEDLEEELAALEGKFHVMASLEEWFGEGLDRVRRGGYSGDDSKLLELLTRGLQGSRAVATHAPSLVEHLLAACKDSESYVRRAAREALVSFVQAAPLHAPSLVEPLLAACKDSDYDVRRAAREALVSFVQAAPLHAPSLVEPLLAACKDSDADVRLAAREALVSFVQAASSHAPFLVEPLLAACKDSESYVRRAAIQALVSFVQAAPLHAPSLVEPLLAACKDDHWNVRLAAIQALGSFVQAAPLHAPSLVEPLLAACKDSYADVRMAAREALVSFVQAAPLHAPSLVEPLLAACKDSDADVRLAAREALVSFVQAAPLHAPSLVEPLLAACKDDHWNVRRAAREALVSFVQAAPLHAPSLVEPLLAAYKDDHWNVRRAAIQALGSFVQAAPLHAPALVEHLLAACKDSESYVRRAAIQALGSFVQAAPLHAPALVEPLLAACKDSDYDVRRAAREALVSFVQAAPLHAPSLVEPLLAACKDDHWNVRLAAIQALVSFVQAAPSHAPSLVEPLLAACKDDHWNVRLAAIQALVSFVQAAPSHAPSLVEPLLAACKDDHWNVRLAAIQALVSFVQAVPLHAPSLVEPLLAACKDSYSSVRLAAISALGSFVQAAPLHAPSLVEPLLAACKDDHWNVRRAAREALVSFVQAAPSHAPALIEPLLAACKDSSSSVRLAAISALVSVVQAAPSHAPSLVEPLLAACKDSESYVRLAAREALISFVQAASWHAPSLVEPLLAACKDSESYVRRAAREALVSFVQAAPLHAPSLVEPLLAACKDSESYVRRAAREALVSFVQAAPLHAPSLVEPLLAACKDSESYVRLAAIQALVSVVQAASWHAPSLVEPLLAACKDSDADVRLAAREALGSFVQAAPTHAPSLVEPLLAACKDSDADVRLAASEALVSFVQAAPTHAPSLVEPLLAACKDDHWNVRRAASEALGSVVQAASWHAPSLVEPLLAACKDDHWNVRRAAIQALGSFVQAAPTHAPSLVEPLLAACKDSDDDVRRAAREALVSVVQAAPLHAPSLVEPLLAACKDSDADVRRAASEALGKFSLQQFIDGYWATQDQALIPLIAPQLYHTPLVVRTSSNPQQQRLILYSTVGKPVDWDKPQQQVQNFVKLIKDAAKQKQRRSWFWPFSLSWIFQTFEYIFRHIF